jgi:hypothetical protein
MGGRLTNLPPSLRKKVSIDSRGSRVLITRIHLRSSLVYSIVFLFSFMKASAYAIGLLSPVVRAIAARPAVAPLRRSLPSRPKSLDFYDPTVTIPRRRFLSDNSDSSLTDTMPKEKTSFTLKTPKGTKDWAGADALLRDRIFSTITQVFKRHGGTALDTPVFELRDILQGKVCFRVLPFGKFQLRSEAR